MRAFFNGTVAKFLVAAGGGVASALSTYYATASWEPAVVIALTAVGVYLVPNAPRPPVAAPVRTNPPNTGV